MPPKKEDLDFDSNLSANFKEALIDVQDATQDLKKIIPTGLPILDLALDVGGIPQGRIIEMFGKEGAGKSSLALHVIKQAQLKGGLAAIIDAEYSFDPDYATTIGIDLNRLKVFQPTTGEQGLGIIEALIEKPYGFTVCVVDSVAALVPATEISGNIGDLKVGLQARMMSAALRRLMSKIGKSDMAVIFVNQLRENIGVTWGPTETTPGGRALKFYSSMRLNVRYREALKREGSSESFGGPYGHIVSVHITKNRLGNPLREVQLEMIYGKGFSEAAALLEALEKILGVVVHKGAWYYWVDKDTQESITLGSGRAKVIDMLSGKEVLPVGVPTVNQMYDLVYSSVNKIPIPLPSVEVVE